MEYIFCHASSYRISVSGSVTAQHRSRSPFSGTVPYNPAHTSYFCQNNFSNALRAQMNSNLFKCILHRIIIRFSSDKRNVNIQCFTLHLDGEKSVIQMPYLKSRPINLHAAYFQSYSVYFLKLRLMNAIQFPPLLIGRKINIQPNLPNLRCIALLSIITDIGQFLLRTYPFSVADFFAPTSIINTIDGTVLAMISNCLFQASDRFHGQ